MRDKIAAAELTRTRLTAFASIVVVGLALACSDNVQNPVAPTPGVSIPDPTFAQFVAGNGPGQCLLKDTQDAAYINNVTSLNCTSNDVDISFATVTLYRINGGSYTALPAGQQISCVPGDNIDAVTTAFIANSANERYDFGLWINPVPDSSAYTGGSCLHFNLIPNSNGAVEIDDTPDQCGDIAGSDTVAIPLDTLHLVCPGGGKTSLSVDACAAWSNGTTGANDLVCPKNPPGGGPGFRQGTTPGTTAKCRCEPLVLPIDVKGVLRIEKQTLPDASSQSFTFTPNYNGGTTFNLTDGQTNNSPPLSAGTYTAAETVPSGWDLTNRECHVTGTATSKSFTPISNGVSVALGAGDDITCVFTNTKRPTLTVNKVCAPTTDNGKFNLRIDAATAGTGGDAACGGTTGAVEVTVGSHTASETAGTGTSLSNYNTPVITGDCASDGSVTLAAGQNKVCTITNTRKPTLQINKVCVPTTDGGKFNLRNDGANWGTGADAVCGGNTGAVVTTIGGHTVSETAGTGTSLSDYATPVIGGACAANGSITLVAGQNAVCTITNTKKARLTVNKICAPTNDGGKFNLRIDGANAGSGADASCGGTTGAVDVSATTHTVSETAGTGTSLTNYATPVIGGDCAADGTVSLNPGDSKTCTITNTRLPRLTITKICAPTNDGGKFNLRNDGANWGTGADASCGGSTGAVNTTIGGHTVSETAGTGTSLTNYAAPVIGGDCASNGSITLVAGDNKTCTITNTRLPRLTITKVCVPTNDGGKFNLRNDGANWGTGADASCGGSTGAVNTTIGGHTVSETAGTGTSLTNYQTPVIGGDCASDGSITLVAGDNKTCTITNTRLPRLTINKVCVPTNDTGKFNLRNDGANWGTGADASCGGGTGAVNTTVGSHTVSETAGTGNSLSHYDAVIGGDCAADGTVSLAAGQSKTCTITNSRLPKFTVKKTVIGAGATFGYTATGSGVTTPFSLSPAANASASTTFSYIPVGTKTVTEDASPGYVLTDLSCDNSLTVYDPLATRTVSTAIAYGDSVTCTFINQQQVSQTTRTQGFWATHTSIANAAWYGGSFGGNSYAGFDHFLCGKELDLAKLMGGFWSNIAKTSTGAKRSDIDKARMQLLQQLLAAELNFSAFGSTPSGMTTTQAEAAFCGSDIDAIKAAQVAMASFNESGDSGAFTPGASATPKNSKDIANYAYWDSLP